MLFVSGCYVVFFFFSSRRRHTRSLCDWSSDVCSSDLPARPGWVLDQTFDLFDRLGATDEQLDFPVIYASALRGFAGLESTVRDGDMQPLFKTIVEHCPPPEIGRASCRERV